MQVPAVATPTPWNTDPVLDPTVGVGELAQAVSTLAQPAAIDDLAAASGAYACVPEPFAARMVGRVMNAQIAAQKRRFSKMGFQERILETSFGAVHLYDRPRPPGVEGPTWVFGHGFSAQAVSWQAVLQHLAPRCARIICVDFPGHGDSPEVPPEQSAIAVTTASCLEAMDYLTGEDGASVVPVGISMGGLAATVYATERPQQTAAAALISPAGAPMGANSLEDLIVNFAPQTYEQARRTVDVFMPNASFKPLMALGMLHLLNNPYCRRLLEDFRTFDYFPAERLQQLPSNTLLLWGTEDTVIPSECRDHFFEHTPSLERFHVPGWNHFVGMYESQALAERLIEWGARHNLLARQGPAHPTQGGT